MLGEVGLFGIVFVVVMMVVVFQDFGIGCFILGEVDFGDDKLCCCFLVLIVIVFVIGVLIGVFVWLIV